MYNRVALTLLSITALIAASCSGDERGCPADAPPATPVLLEVTQDPETLTVTATVRDESDNEQWFALERTFIAGAAISVVVGTDVPAPDADRLPLGRDTGRTLNIDDRGIVEDQKPRPGLEYVYTVRAWNCFYPSNASNDIKILSLFPR